MLNVCVQVYKKSFVNVFVFIKAGILLAYLVYQPKSLFQS